MKIEKIKKTFAELSEQMEDAILVNDVPMQISTKTGEDYAMCFYCSKFFSPDIIDGELQLFCSEECEKKDNEYWKEFIENPNKKEELNDETQ